MNKDEIVEHLRKLGNGEIEPRNSGEGLCDELEKVCRVDCWPFLDLNKTWPESADEAGSYPVEGEEDRYEDNYQKWSKNTKTGRRRLALCLWTANQIEAGNVMVEPLNEPST